MVHRELSEGKEPKVRGRPFLPGNKRGISSDKILVAKGSASGVRRPDLKPKMPLKADGEKSSTDSKIPILESNEETFSKVPVELIKENNNLETIETLNFKKGDNVLSIRFSKRHNRMFRIQIFLNGELEIRPVTYTGSRTGNAFWNLLKGALKK